MWQFSFHTFQQFCLSHDEKKSTDNNSEHETILYKLES